MKKLFIGIVLSLLAFSGALHVGNVAPALAQNILCPDKYFNDSSNACANTRWGIGNFIRRATQVNLYVSKSGLDTNDCLAATTTVTVTGTHGPCLTIVHAAAVGYGFDAVNQTIVINIAAGTYTDSLLLTGENRGHGSATSAAGGYLLTYFWLNGVGATTILDQSSSSLACGTITTSGSVYLLLGNLKLAASSNVPCGGSPSGLFAQAGSRVIIGSGVTFGTAIAQQIHVEGGAYVEVAADYHIGGSATSHVGNAGGIYLLDGYQGICDGNYAFGNGFYYGTSNAIFNMIVPNPGFSGCGSVTGRKLLLKTNSTMDLNGTTTFYAQIPGNSAASALDPSAVISPWPTPSVSSCVNGAVSSSSTDNDIRISWTGVGATCTVAYGIPKAIDSNCYYGTTSGATAISLGPSAAGVVVQGSFANGMSVYLKCASFPL